MPHYCYILYSKSLDRFYTGESSDIEQRLQYHNLGFSGFTAKASDWELYLLIECADRPMARKIEKHIKSMKSVKYIKSLRSDDDLIAKLKSKYTVP